ncbi:hypothetical protein [Azospirillum soli]|uniref:hypothetical protein n=1 Tax=Azospirillum soli TaxID=1304799 RepID=UPI001AE80C82|nr:hypothetical protein [Azospirillum soli]MBP2312928.1 hypothetical protein [Azospirillum soli]
MFGWLSKKKRGAVADGVAQGTTQFAAHAGANAARAADMVDPGWAAVKRMLESEAGKLNSADPRWAQVHRAQACGNVFETLNDLKDNIGRAEAGKPGTWQNTRLQGANTAPQDSVLVVDGKVILARQDKLLSGPTVQNLKSLANEKYAGMDLAVPDGEVSAWKEAMLKLAERSSDPEAKARYLDAAKRLRAGVSRDDVTQTVSDGKRYHLELQLKAYGKEVVVTAGSAALGAAVIGGTVSVIRHSVQLARGQTDASTAAKAIAAETGSATARAAGQAALAVTIRTAAEKAGVQALRTGAPAAVAATAVVEVGRSIYHLVKGNMTPDEAAEALGQTGCTTLASFYAGGAAAAAFGQAGAVTITVAGVSAPISVPVILAATAASIVTAAVYQSCIAIFKTARLDKAEAERVMALAEAAAAELRRQRMDLEARIDSVLAERDRALAGIFHVLDYGIDRGDPSAVMAGLGDFAGFLGTRLRFATLDAFTHAMAANEPLVL